MPHTVFKPVTLCMSALASVLIPLIALATPLTQIMALPYAQGQAYVRLFEDHLMPGTCGIILEREQCNRDFQTERVLRGGDPTDLQMQMWLASGDIALKPKEWNGSMVPEEAWTTDPVFAWWYTAGAASIAGSLPRNAGTLDYVSSIVAILKKHAVLAPETIRPALLGNETFSTAHRLQAALNRLQPVQPFPIPVFGSTPSDDARLGVYLSTLQELIDNPVALSRPESRAFATAVLARFQALHDDLHDGVSFADVQSILAGEIPINPGEIDAQLRQPLSTVLSPKWPKARRQSLLLGMAIAQVGYNAAVLKDLKSDQQFRGVISTLPPYVGMSRESHDAIAALQNIPYGEWSSINPAAAKVALAIVSER